MGCEKKNLEVCSKGLGAFPCFTVCSRRAWPPFCPSNLQISKRRRSRPNSRVCAGISAWPISELLFALEPTEHENMVFRMRQDKAAV